MDYKGKKMNKQWKVVELKIARFLGGDRNPITGRVRDNTLPDIGKAKVPSINLPDAEQYSKHANYAKICNGWLFDIYNFEIKHRKSLPKWLLDIQKTLISYQGTHYYSNCYLTTLENFRNSFMKNREISCGMSDALEFPEWILDAKNQAEMSGEDKKAVVVLHGKNQKIKDSLVIVWY